MTSHVRWGSRRIIRSRPVSGVSGRRRTQKPANRGDNNTKRAMSRDSRSPSRRAGEGRRPARRPRDARVRSEAVFRTSGLRLPIAAASLSHGYLKPADKRGSPRVRVADRCSIEQPNKPYVSSFFEATGSPMAARRRGTRSSAKPPIASNGLARFGYITVNTPRQFARPGGAGPSAGSRSTESRRQNTVAPFDRRPVGKEQSAKSAE